MRSSIIIAGFIALAAALPTIVPVDENSLAVRTESLGNTVALEPRQGFSVYDETFSWPDSQVYGGGLSAQFQADNLGNGQFKFQFWSSAPANAGVYNFRVSYGGKTLASVNLAPGKTTTTTIAKTGDNFNIFVQPA